jgi:hypothetical protein
MTEQTEPQEEPTPAETEGEEIEGVETETTEEGDEAETSEGGEA